MDARDLGRTLLLRRQHLGLRQDELAELAEVSERFVRELEHGKPSVRLDKVSEVLDALGLTLTVSLKSK